MKMMNNIYYNENVSGDTNGMSKGIEYGTYWSDFIYL
jgi:hypothetical protein